MDRLISLNAVLSAIGEWIAHREYDYTNATEYLRNRIKAIPSAEPRYYPPCEDCHKKMDEIRKAYDKIQSEEPKTRRCPHCGIEQFADKYFCPDCGSPMEGE